MHEELPKKAETETPIKRRSNKLIIFLILFIVITPIIFCGGLIILTKILGKYGTSTKLRDGALTSVSTDNYVFYYPRTFSKRVTDDKEMSKSFMKYDSKNDNAVIINFWDGRDSSELDVCQNSDLILQQVYAMLLNAEQENVKNIKNEQLITDKYTGCIISAEALDNDGDQLYIKQKYIQSVKSEKGYLIAVVATSQKGNDYSNAINALEKFEVK